MAKKKKKQSFKNPHGLTITRVNATFKFEWQRGQTDYKDQELKYAWIDSTTAMSNVKTAQKKGDLSKSVTWHKISVDKNDTKKSAELPTSKYYPSNQKTKLVGVVFVVRAKKEKWHEWIYKIMDIDVPKNAKQDEPVNETSAVDKTIFSWTPPKETENTPFVDYEYQTMRINSNYHYSPADLAGDRMDWSGCQNGTLAKNVTSKEIIDSDAGSAVKFTRCFRIRPRGYGGNGKWKANCHVYGAPDNNYAPTVGSVSQDKNGGTNYGIENTFTSFDKFTSAEIKYLIEVPTYNSTNQTILPPAGSSNSWTLYQTRAGGGKTLIKLQEGIQSDSCAWVKTTLKNGEDPSSQNDSPIVLMDFGGLTPPTISIPGPPVEATAKLVVNVTNRCSIVGSNIAIVCKISSEAIIHIIENCPINEAQRVTVQLPASYKTASAVSIGAFAYLGKIVKEDSRKNVNGETTYDEYTVYTLDTKLTNAPGFEFQSKTTWQDADIPVAPTNLVVTKVPDSSTLNVRWSVPWKSSTGAEVAWSDHADAMYSTNAPSTFQLEISKAQMLNIADLAMGVSWHIWVRLFKEESDGTIIYGPYARATDETYGFALTEIPIVPYFELSKTVILKGETVKAMWTYVTQDTTRQSMAIVYERTGAAGNYSYREVDRVEGTQQYFDIDTSEQSTWTEGTSHDLVLMAISESEQESEYSSPVTLKIAAAFTASISTDLDTGTETIGEETRDILKLTSLPLNITVSGTSGTSKDIKIYITRKDDYPIYRPDESTDVGYAGETIYQSVIEDITDASIVDQITMEELASEGKHFDDGCRYYISYAVSNTLGQTVDNFDDPIEFLVEWDHQAVAPEADVSIQSTSYFLTDDVEIDYSKTYYTRSGAGTIQNPYIYMAVQNPVVSSLPNYYEVGSPRQIALITPSLPDDVNPSDYANDTVDIYRLSGDKPERIIHNGAYGTVYVDPYPTIGDQGGYRIVMTTVNGDCTEQDGIPAWNDYVGNINTKFQLIDFNGREIHFKYNVSLDNSWNKRFTTTKYLGGSTQGDWDKGIDRTGTVKGVTFYDLEPDVYQDLRDLAEHDGICRLRTIDGTNIPCNIDVSDNSTFNSLEHQHDISLSFTKVDNYQDDGMTLEEWNSGDNA